ncbi:hypothetical protein ACFL2T_01105 [Elusimicrobiota bacterium]
MKFSRSTIVLATILAHGLSLAAHASPKAITHNLIPPEHQALRTEATSLSGLLQHIRRNMESFSPEELARILKALRRAETAIKSRELGKAQEVYLLTNQLSHHVALIGTMGKGTAAHPTDADLRKETERLSKIRTSLEKDLGPEVVDATRGYGLEWDAISGLGAVRAALSIYYGDHEGRYPDDLKELKPKYLGKSLCFRLPYHPESCSVRNVTAKDRDELLGLVDDKGGLLYVNDKNSPLWGTIMINCTHEPKFVKVKKEPFHNY